MLAIENDVFVDLIGDAQDVVLVCDPSELAYVFFALDGSRWIRGAVDDEG